ncbi:MAG: YitT family protein [Oscillospiraceae bacterium]|nr:YitT family protein [Oscillospiraceae bacterium]
MKQQPLSVIKDYLLILLGSILYAASTVLFIFPHGVLLGGTSGISVILESFLPFSPGTILMVINFLLIILAFVLLGRDMAVRTLVGSVLTTLAVGLLEKPLTFAQPLLASPYLSALTGACLIAVASGVMFYVRSSSGGTDVIALIVQKYSHISIGKALLITDVLIVIAGGLLSGLTVFIASALGLLVKTFGIDFVIGWIKKLQSPSKT